MIEKKELKELDEMLDSTYETERLNQMAKDIVRVEYYGYNSQNNTTHKTFEEKMFDAYIVREGYSETYFHSMSEKAVEERDRKWFIVWKEISFLMFKNIAFELCLNGNFSCDSERNVEHLLLELRRVDRDVQDYEWDESKNDFSKESAV